MTNLIRLLLSNDCFFQIDKKLNMFLPFYFCSCYMLKKNKTVPLFYINTQIATTAIQKY